MIVMNWYQVKVLINKKIDYIMCLIHNSENPKSVQGKSVLSQVLVCAFFYLTKYTFKNINLQKV